MSEWGRSSRPGAFFPPGSPLSSAFIQSSLSPFALSSYLYSSATFGTNVSKPTPSWFFCPCRSFLPRPAPRTTHLPTHPPSLPPGAPAGVWKLDKIVAPTPGRNYVIAGTVLGALFWAHVTIRMYENGADKFIGHHRNWVVDLANDKVYDTAHDDVEEVDDAVFTDMKRVEAYAKR